MPEALSSVLARRTGVVARTTCGTGRGGGPSLVIEFACDGDVEQAFLAILSIAAPAADAGAREGWLREGGIRAAGRALDRSSARAARVVRAGRVAIRHGAERG